MKMKVIMTMTKMHEITKMSIIYAWMMLADSLSLLLIKGLFSTKTLLNYLNRRIVRYIFLSLGQQLCVVCN